MAASTLKILRELNNLTQAFVAEDVLGLSQSTYARLELNPLKITAAQAQQLADLYKVPVGHLLSKDKPVIIFEDAVHDNRSGDINNRFDVVLKALQTQNELLIQQNTELVKLLNRLNKQAADISYT